MSRHAVPRAEKPRSSISTTSVGVKQSCTSASEICAAGSVTPACSYASRAAVTTSGKVVKS